MPVTRWAVVAPHRKPGKPAALSGPLVARTLLSAAPALLPAFPGVHPACQAPAQVAYYCAIASARPPADRGARRVRGVLGAQERRCRHVGALPRRVRRTP